jgi:catechol 2,3-dioxygenase-like lactoylglutathione lyase family enzyme
MDVEQATADDLARQIGLPKVGQMGYVVADIDQAIAFCRDAFGIRPWLLLEERPDPCVQRGTPLQAALKLALAYAGPVQVELIQVLEGETFHLDHVAAGRTGLHHLGYMVNDLEKRLEACHAAGVEVLQRGCIRESGFTVDYAYLDTVEKAGIVLELIRWRLGPLPMPVNRLMFNAVCALGAWTLFRGRVIK